MVWQQCLETSKYSVLGIKYLELALEKKINLGSRSLEALSAIYSQLGNAYFVLRNFTRALEYHRHDLETAKFVLVQ